LEALVRIKLLAAAVAAAALAACGTTGSGTIPASHDAASSLNGSGLTLLSTFTARDDATGTLVHILPPSDALKTARGNGRVTESGSGNLMYGGGSVQTNPKLFVVYWGSAWSGSGDPNGVQSRLNSFYGVIGGSAWLNVVTQYTQSGGAHAGNPSTLYGGYWIDTGSTPPSRPSQSQMAAEAARAATHFGSQGLTVGNYVVAMPHGISPSGFGTQYCAYHSTTSASGTTIAWTALPYMPDAGASCGAGSVNSPGTLDGVTIVAGHELAEVIIDPNASSGWMDSSGEEIADKCAWIGLIDNPAAGGYPTQPLWSNATSSCVQSYP
jgi:serine protease